MFASTRREFLGQLAVATAAGSALSSSASTPLRPALGQHEHGTSEHFVHVVSRHQVRTDSPPAHIPKATTPDAILLGNGSMLAAFAGTPDLPQFWLTLNDFWEMREWGGPRPLGRVILEMPSLRGGSYHSELDLATATVKSTFGTNGSTVIMTSWVAATERLLVVEFEVTGVGFEGRLSFRFPDELGLGVEKNEYWEYDQGGEPRGLHLPQQERSWVDEIVLAQRTYHINTQQPTRAALAARFLGRTGSEGNLFRLDPGVKQVFVAACESWFTRSNPLDCARDRVANFDLSQLDSLRASHHDWWDRYWSTSLVEINEPRVERQYYLSHYNMGSLSRDPDFPPCDYGICTSDDPVCAADYKLNYNYQTAFLGLNVAGHFDQTAPYDAPGLAHLPQACADAHRLLSHGGAYMSLGLGPKSMVAEHIWLGQKSQNAFYLVNMAERWYLTRQNEYGRKIYPLVREVVRFWEEDLRWTGDRYQLVNDSAQEESDHCCVNPSSGVALVRMAMRLALDISSEFNLDEDKRDKWRHILDRVGPIPVRDAGTLHSIFDSPGMSLQDVYPTGSLAGKPVIVFEEEGVDWSFECNVQASPIYPAGEIGLDSDPALLEAARNTVALRVLSETQGHSWPGMKPSGIEGGAWFDSNTGCLFFPAAVRVGYDPEEIWKNLVEWSTNRIWTNGFRRNINDGIENCSTVPNTLHEMMLLSHENVLRIFRVWPRKSVPSARFLNLWAHGGFQVSATLLGGEVSHLQIHSHLGRNCIVENPWAGSAVKLSRDGRTEERLRGERLNIVTKAGEFITLEKV